MSIKVSLDILNQKGTPAFYSDTFANRPSAGFAGRVFISTDTGAIYEDTGSTWTLIADAGAGTTGTLQQVTTNGKTTDQGITVTAGGVATNSLTVQGSRASFYNGTASQLGMTLQNGSIPSTLTRGDLWLYSGTSANNNLVLANDLYSSQFILPTSNQVFTFPAATGTIGLSSSALTTGSVVFAGSGGTLSESNATFFWDNTNKRLGIGNSAPGAPLDIHGTGTAAQFNGTGTNNAYLIFQNAGANKWRVGNLYNAGANSFEFVDAARSTNVMSLRSTGTYQEVYVNGYNTISNIASFSSSGNYAINPSLTLSIPSTTTFNSGASWSGMATSLLNTWGANNTIDQGAVMAGFIGVNRQSFSTTGLSITLNQGSNGIRAICGMQVLNQTGGTNAGTISHGASLLVQGVYPSGSANVTYTNYYGLLLNQLDEFGTVTFTNRWGIYQGGASDKNYFAATTLIGTTTDAGYKLDVNGTGRFSGLLYANANIVIGSATNTNELNIYGAVSPTIKFQNSGADRARISANNANTTYNSLTGNGHDFQIDGTSYLKVWSSAGNVGIGPTTDSGAKLQITKTGITYSSAAIYISTSGGTDGLAIGDNGASSYKSIQSYGGQPLVINSLGNNVLIGTTTDNGNKLQVNGTGYFSGNLSYNTYGNLQTVYASLSASTTRTVTITGTLNGTIQIMVSMYGNGSGSASRAMWMGGGYLQSSLPYTEITRVNGGTTIISAITVNATSTVFTLQNVFAFNTADATISVICNSANQTPVTITVT